MQYSFRNAINAVNCHQSGKPNISIFNDGSVYIDYQVLSNAPICFGGGFQGWELRDANNNFIIDYTAGGAVSNLAAGTYTVNAIGCVMNSSITFTLTASTSCATTTSTTDVTICTTALPYTWNGTSYTTAGTHTVTLVNAGGCDSLAILNLTTNVCCVNTASTTDVTICTNQLPYTWNGFNYATAGTHNVTLTNAAGCDSIATLNLTTNVCCVNTASTSDVTICTNQFPYTWNGTSYNAAGTHTVTLVNAAGCDSIATLIIKIKVCCVTTYSTSNESFCFTKNPYSWNGSNYYTSGTYTAKLVNANGCDSMATLNLTVNTPTYSTTNETACDSYTWNGRTYTTSGTYNFTTTNSNGCDSTATLFLTITTAPTVTLLTASAPCDNPKTLTLSGLPTGASVQWFLNNQSFTNGSGSSTPFTVIAGGNGVGNAINQLNENVHICRDAAGNIYITDSENDRVLRVDATSNAITIAAGGNGRGTANNQLNRPVGVSIAANGLDLIITDHYNHRIVRWTIGATNGTTIAGTNNSGSTASQLSYPLNAVEDSKGNIYVVDRNNNRIQRFANGSTTGFTVAGGNGNGSALNQLNLPTDVDLDNNEEDLIIADRFNGRVIRWTIGATAGTVEAANGLSQPYAIFIAANSTKYITDVANNNVTSWAANATTGTVVAGVNPTLNYPTGTTTNNNGCLVISDLGNSRVITNCSITNNTISTSTAGTYTAIITSNGCTTTAGPLVITMPVVEQRNNDIVGCGQVVFNKTTYTSSTVVDVTLKDVNGCDSIITHNNIIIKDWEYTTQTSTIIACGSVTRNGIVYTSPTILYDTIDGDLTKCQKIALEINIYVTPWAIVKDTITKSGCGSVVYGEATYATNTILSVNTIDSTTCTKRFTTIILTVLPNIVVRDTVRLSGCESVLYNDVTYTQNDTLRLTTTVVDSCLTRHKVVIITINQNPVITLTNTSSPCGNPQIITIGGANAANITNVQWFRNGSLISNNARTWTGVGVTVAGTTGISGTANNLLRNPHGVFVVGNDMYISDWSNNRILRWAIGANRGTTIVGGISAGLNNPSNVFVNNNRDIYITDYTNSRVRLYTNATGAITTVATGLNFPRGMFVRANGNVVVAASGNNRIEEWTPGATSGTQLVTTVGRNIANIVEDANGNIYIADQGNNQILRNDFGTNTTTVVGRLRDATTNLFAPWGIFIRDNFYYVTENIGHTVLRYPLNATNTTIPVVVAGTGLRGNSATEFNIPDGVFVDNNGRVFVADELNHRIQMFDSLQRSISVVASGTYTVIVTDINGCTSSATIDVNIPAPVVRDTNRINGCGKATNPATNISYTFSTTIIDTNKTVNGCDSSIKVTIITVTPWTIFNDTTRLSGCPKVVFNGVDYFTNDTIRTSKIKEDSCLVRNSVVIITINPFTTVRDTSANTACGSLTVMGIKYTTSTNVTRTYDDSANCVRHIDVLVITIKPYKFSYDTVYKTGCDTLTYNGKIYNSTTTFNDTIVVDDNKCTAIVRTVNIIIRTGAACACYTNALSLSTGLNASGQLKNNLEYDDNWTIANGPSQFSASYPQAAYVIANGGLSYGWSNVLNNSQWIAPTMNIIYDMDTTTPFTFTKTICIEKAMIYNASFEVLCDDSCYVLIDGVQVAKNTSRGYNWQNNNKINFNQNIYLTAGTHTIEVKLKSVGAKLGINVSGALTTLDGSALLQQSSCCLNTGTISGVKFKDRNFNAALDMPSLFTGDSLMSGFTIQLKNSLGNVVATATTNNHGQYTFSNIAPDIYTVSEVQQAGYIQSFPVNNASHNIVVISGAVKTANFGNVKPIATKKTATGCAPFTILGRTFVVNSMFQDTVRNSLGVVTELVDYTVIVTPRLTPTISISATQTQLCIGGSTILSAIVTNVGTLPTYQWFSGTGVVIAGATSSTYTASPTAASTTYYCVVKTSLPCFEKETSTSNAITITISKQVAPTITISSSIKTTLCAGNNTAILTATITNGGISPIYQWTKNGVNISGANAATYTATTIANTDVYACKLTSNASCLTTASATSNNITFTILPTTMVNAITGVNNICVGATTQLAATPAGGVWASLNNRVSVNATGLVTGLNATTTTQGQVTYTINGSNGCVSSATYNVNVFANPGVPSISYAPGTVNPQTGAGGAFCTNRTFTVVGTPSGGVWSRTGVLSVNPTSGIVFTGTQAGAASLTYTFTNAGGCSNFRTIPNSIVTCLNRGAQNSNVDLQQSAIDFTLYPNPAKQNVNLNIEKLVGGGKIIVTDLYGKQVIQQTLSMGTNNINITNLAKGLYFVSTITSNEKITKKLVVE